MCLYLHGNNPDDRATYEILLKFNAIDKLWFLYNSGSVWYLLYELPPYLCARYTYYIGEENPNDT